MVQLEPPKLLEAFEYCFNCAALCYSNLFVRALQVQSRTQAVGLVIPTWGVLVKVFNLQLTTHQNSSKNYWLNILLILARSSVAREKFSISLEYLKYNINS